jgi:hypothetical protein
MAVVIEGGTATWPRRRAVAHAQREEDEVSSLLFFFFYFLTKGYDGLAWAG